MRIAQLIDSLTVGGAEKLQVTFARSVRELDVEITVVSLYRKPYRAIVDELEALGVRVVTLAGRGTFDPLRAGRLARLLRGERFDVVFTHLTAANILGTAAAALAGTPCVATLHNVKPPPQRIKRVLEGIALRRLARHVVAVGGAVAEAHRCRLGEQGCSVIPNPVEAIPALSASERAALRQELSGVQAEFIFMSTGMLNPQKAFGDLLTAFAELRRTHPTAALVIAGAGPLAPRLEAQIDELGLRGRVRLLGLRDDVPRLLAAVDGYVSSSLWEGLPLSVLEAMSAGLPVVATAVGDIPAVIVDGTGVLVPPAQPPALAAALRSLLDDPDRAAALSSAARRHVATHYSPRVWADRLLALASQAARGELGDGAS